MNFAHVNGRSFYIVDRRMVMVEREMYYTIKREGKVSERGKCPGDMSRVKFPDPAAAMAIPWD